MRPSPFFLVLLLFSLTTSAQTPPGETVEASGCKSEEALLLQDIDVAQARGRMLQRRQLVEQLEAVRMRCGTLPPAWTREESIARLQREILELHKELDRAETELRKLKQGL